MSNHLSYAEELIIIAAYAQGDNYRTICEELKHGKTQVSRTLQSKNVCMTLVYTLIRLRKQWLHGIYFLVGSLIMNIVVLSIIFFN